MTPSSEWALNSVKGKVFVRTTAPEALRAVADWFEPMQKERTLLAITIEYDQEEVTLTAIWEEKP